MSHSIFKSSLVALILVVFIKRIRGFFLVSSFEFQFSCTVFHLFQGQYSITALKLRTKGPRFSLFLSIISINCSVIDCEW